MATNQINHENKRTSEDINLTNWKKLTRQGRGQLISKYQKITKTPIGWRVPSQSKSGSAYLVKLRGDEPKCNCPDCEIRRKKCKHIYAVEFYIKQEISKEGKVTQTKGVKISYSQKWKAYDKSQTNEKIIFMKLLNDLCSSIEQPEYKFGRPTLPISELLFSSVMKVYTTFSLRRFMSDIKIAKEMGLMDKVPCYSSVGHFLQRKDLTKLLKKMIEISATPLASIEKDFAVDSSGFSTSRFARYFDYKYGKESKYRIWIKGHLLSGVKTNIVIRAEVTEGKSHDSPQLAPLIKEVSKRFNLREVSCDRAYSSRENLKLIENEGAVPFVPFKTHVTGKKPKYPIWRKMFHFFLYKHEEFLEHYHKRSNSETVFHMIKTKFRDNLRSKDKTAQINELLCKVLCHNICVIIQETNELGLKGKFVIGGRK